MRLVPGRVHNCQKSQAYVGHSCLRRHAVRPRGVQCAGCKGMQLAAAADSVTLRVPGRMVPTCVVLTGIS